MLGVFKLVLCGGLLAALPFVNISSASLDAPQDPVVGKPAAAGGQFHQTSRWNFAELQYTTVDGKTRTIPARRLSKLWLLARPDGGLYLEVLYENADYSLLSLQDMHIIRRSATHASVDVPVVRADLSSMAFPAFK